MAGANGETSRLSWAKGAPTSPRGVVRVGGQDFGPAAGSPDSVSRALHRTKFIAKRHRVRHFCGSPHQMGSLASSKNGCHRMLVSSSSGQWGQALLWGACQDGHDVERGWRWDAVAEIAVLLMISTGSGHQGKPC